METFIIDWPICVFIGLVFGAFAPRARWWRSRAFAFGLLTVCVFTATAIVSYLIEPDWMWMYFLDPKSVAWSVPFLAIGYVLTFALAFAGAIALRDIGGRAVWTAAALALAAEVVVVAITWDRYHRVGSRAEWAGDSAHELFSLSPTGPARTIGLLGPIFVVVLAASILLARRARDAGSSDR